MNGLTFSQATAATCALLTSMAWATETVPVPVPPAGGENLVVAKESTPMLVAQADVTPVSAMDDLRSLSLEMTNPFGSVFSVFNHVEYTQFDGDLAGAGDQTRTLWDITVSFPFLLDSGKKIVARVNFPVNFGEPTYNWNRRDYVDWRIRQDADFLPDNQPWFDGHGHLSDMSWDVAWGGVNDEGWITGFGLAGVLPTGQDGSIERDQYLLGPDITFGKISDWGMLGARLTHLTNVADVSRPDDPVTWDTNETQLKVFFAYPLRNNWSLISNPTIVYDWEATDDNKVLLPLGGGVSKMMRWWNVPVKLDMELEYFAITPDTFGPQWLARISLSPAIFDRAGR